MLDNLVDNTRNYSNDYKSIQLPAFDLFTKTISYKNGKRRVSTTAFEVNYYPDNTTILNVYCAAQLLAITCFQTTTISFHVLY